MKTDIFPDQTVRYNSWKLREAIEFPLNVSIAIEAVSVHLDIWKSAS